MQDVALSQAMQALVLTTDLAQMLDRCAATCYFWLQDLEM